MNFWELFFKMIGKPNPIETVKELEKKSKYKLGFSDDGLSFITIEKSSGKHHIHKLTKAWDYSTMHYCGVIEEPLPIEFYNTGRYMFVYGNDGKKYYYMLSEAWNIETAELLPGQEEK